MWLLTKEAVLTHENLKESGYQLASRCTLCEEHAETINHPFFCIVHGQNNYGECSLV